MNDLLLRIEEACLNMEGLSLGIPAGIAVVLGLILWLGGNRYSGFVIGVLGAGAGAVLGLMLSDRFDWPVSGAVAIGAAVSCLLAVVFRRLVILILAALIFAAVVGGGYFSYRINTESWDEKLDEIKQRAMSRSLESGEEGDTAEHDYLRILAQRYRPESAAGETGDGDSRATRKFREIWAEIRYAASENKGMLLLWGAVGAIVGLGIAWAMKMLVTALCCSIVGAAAVISGMTGLLLAKGTPVITSLMKQPRVIGIIFIVMIAFGLLMQILIGTKKKKEIPEKKEDKPS